MRTPTVVPAIVPMVSIAMSVVSTIDPAIVSVASVVALSVEVVRVVDRIAMTTSTSGERTDLEMRMRSDHETQEKTMVSNVYLRHMEIAKIENKKAKDGKDTG